MAEVNMAAAMETYETLCRMLDTRDWHYQKYEDDLVIKASIKGDDFPIDFIMRVNPRNQIVSFISWLPFKISEDKRIDAAVAVCVANYGLADGSFDYDVTEGEISFRLTSSFRECKLSEDLLEYMLMVSAGTIDDYNDKFFMLSKGMLSIQQFIEAEKR